jgi:hypothetical protein
MADHISASARPLIALVALVAALALAGVAALAGAPTAEAASCNTQNLKTYSLPNANGYITSLSVTKVSCKTGRRLALAFYKCRHKKGKEGRCTDKVLGYSCRETKRTKIPTEINARVSCKLGARRVIHTYEQIL